MYSDLISKESEIIQLNQKIILPYNPVFSLFTQKVYEQNIQDYKVQTTSISNVDDIMSKSVRPTATELQHVKATKKSFEFSLDMEALAFNESQLQQDEGTKATVSAQILKQLTIKYDRMAINGYKSNTGLLTNPNTETRAEKSILTINDLLKVFTDIKGSISEAVQSEEEDIIFLLFGKKLFDYLDEITGNSGKTNKGFMEDNIGAGNYEKVGSFVNDGLMIVGFQPSMTILHRGMLPQVWDQGTNNEKKYDYLHFAHSTNAVEVTDKSAVIVQPIKFTI